jgi:intracellular multiplication protein IcmO
MKSQRGLESRHEQATSKLLRDTRSTGQKVSEFLKNPLNSAMLIAFFSCISFIKFSTAQYAWNFSMFSDIFFFVNVFLFANCYFRESVLPFRLPQRSHKKDGKDIIPGTKKKRKARGIYFFGNEKKTNEELWFSNEDMRTHVLIFGSTGSGKTEALVSISYNALVQGSGFIYVDGKGDNSLFAKIFSMTRAMGRSDDLLLINFMTGAKDILGPQEKRISNTINPFSAGSSGMLTNLIVSMMDSGGSGGDGDMWKGRAIAFVEALMKVLVAMRDAGYILLDANSIRNYFSLERLESMVIDKVFIRDGQYPISIEHVPDIILEPMYNYVVNLPGYHKDRRGKQVSQVFEQHGYITMQLTRIFSSLADTYGHIIRTKLAEVDMKDVVLNRRIMVVLLPALEKSPDELANLGKVIIASLKTMLAAGLGDAVEGKYRDLIERKPTNSDTPFLCILDEYGYYAVKGFAVVPAQARSLGFSVVFAGQDLPAFQKASKEEAASIGANTNIKICMKLEDPTETWEFFMKGAGEAYVTQVESFQANTSSIANRYMDTRGAKVEKRARIDLQDLKEQVEGDMHIFFKSGIVRARAFYANPPAVHEMRLNQFLKVDLPKDGDLYTLVKGIEDFEALCQKGAPQFFASEQKDAVDQLADRLAGMKRGSQLEKAIHLLVSAQHEEAASGLVAQSSEDNFSIFSSPNLTELHKVAPWASEELLKEFLRPVLMQAYLSKMLPYVMQLLGEESEYAEKTVKQLLEDLYHLTVYEAPSIAMLDAGAVASALNQFVDSTLPA